MTRSQDARPAPEALLAEARKEGRGKLKVFLGPYPGVGKTYAMLSAAQERRREGIDIVIGVVESHGRKDTEAMMRGLEQIPRKRLTYRGQSFGEMDLDAILARNPAICLVDELAHTNIPGSRHAKRWQDVEELRDAGIDVYTTVNVQHLESLNDIVERIAGVQVRETLPDHVLAAADEIELIDLPPDDLIQRLREGKVYVRDQIGRALHNFFSKGNLTAFRELALRAAADRVDAQMLSYMQTHAVAGPWPATDRILVCVNESESAKTLIRAARRQADRAKAPWIALHARTQSYDNLPAPSKDRIEEAMRLADGLGAETATIHVDGPVADAILNFARERNVSRIVIGRPRRRRFDALFRETVAEALNRKGRDFEFSIIPDAAAVRSTIVGWSFPTLPKAWRPYAFACGASAMATLAAALLFGLLPLANLSIVFLMAVLATAVRFGVWPSLLAGLVSALLYNFFFTEPYLTFSVIRHEDVLTLVFFFIMSIVVGNLAGRLRTQSAAARDAARLAETLYGFTRRMSGSAALSEIASIGVSGVSQTIGLPSILVVRSKGTLSTLASSSPADTMSLTDQSAAEWTLRSGKIAGWSSDTLPSSNWLFLPLASRSGEVLGVLGVCAGNAGLRLDADRRRLLDTMASQIASAMDRIQMSTDIEEARLLTETEKLRTALLSAVSHDLRTPLVSIIGSATALNDLGNRLSEDDRASLTRGILDEAQRLNRFVQNLLDMTRLGYGAIRLNRVWSDMREVAGHAVRAVLGRAGADRVRLVVEDNIPEIFIDPVVIEQVLVNLIDNALKHGNAKGEVIMSIYARGGDLVVDVTDEGPGIPDEEREAVFDMFHRVRAGDRQVAGTGLGLAICRGLVEAHGGTVRAETPPSGRGACIRVRLPSTPMPADRTALTGNEAQP